MSDKNITVHLNNAAAQTWASYNNMMFFTKS